MMAEELVPTGEAIDKLLGMLRGRLEEAFEDKKKVRATISSSLPRGATSFKEKDCDFSFTLWIEGR